MSNLKEEVVTPLSPFQKLPTFLEVEGKMARDLEKSTNEDNKVLIEITALDRDKAGHINLTGFQLVQ